MGTKKEFKRSFALDYWCVEGLTQVILNESSINETQKERASTKSINYLTLSMAENLYNFLKSIPIYSF